MADPSLDHNYLSFITTSILVVLSVIGVMLRGWFKHVNDNFNKLWQKIEDEAKAREKRWTDLHEKCEAHAKEIARLQGRLDGKAKVLSSMGDPK